MDMNTLLEHVSLMEAQSRNEETARIEEEALHRETKSQLHAAQEQLVLIRDREKQLIEKNANLTALKDTLETSVNQLTSDLKGSKVEMSILKEFAAKQETLLKAARLDFLQKLEEVNEKMLKRNSDIDKMVALARGDVSPSVYDAHKSGNNEELDRIRQERDSANRALKEHEEEIKALTEELEKDRKYPCNSTMYEMEEMINELRTCRNCGSVREDITY